MSTRKKIEEFKQKLKLAGMIATMGTMTLSSCTPNTNSKDSDKDKIETVKWIDNAEENTVYQSFRESIEEHDVNKLKNSLANGGRQYINSADDDRAGLPLYDAIDELDMLYIYQKGIDSVKNDPNIDDVERNLLLNHVVSYGNQEDELAKNIQSSKKIIEILVQNGADISLLPQHVLEYEKEHHPETYKCVMDATQNNAMMKNKIGERGR